MLKQALFAMLQTLLVPFQHKLSRIMHCITRQKNKTFKNALIRIAIKLYKIDLDAALKPDMEAYDCFNDFFTRRLKPEARPIAADADALISPADGAISQIGDIEAGRIFQAKGRQFDVLELLGGDAETAKPFMEGKFATIYLSPRDYHRLHMPLNGQLQKMIHVPGKLFSVNRATANYIPRLFARNERVIALFDTDAGPMAYIMVGAIFVSSIETVWQGVITPPSTKTIRTWDYPEAKKYKKGEEIGQFNMGSTVIVLFGKNAIEWQKNLKADEPLQMGQKIGQVIKNT